MIYDEKFDLYGNDTTFEECEDTYSDYEFIKRQVGNTVNSTYEVERILNSQLD